MTPSANQEHSLSEVWVPGNVQTSLLIRFWFANWVALPPSFLHFPHSLDESGQIRAGNIPDFISFGRFLKHLKKITRLYNHEAETKTVCFNWVYQVASPALQVCQVRWCPLDGSYGTLFRTFTAGSLVAAC